MLKSVLKLAMMLGFAITPALALADGHGEETKMERHTALGIGGFFFVADDAAALSQWYERHLGINPVPQSYDDVPWVQEAGPTIVAPFPKGADGMIPQGKNWMLNLRVADLDGFAEQLRSEGIEVTIDAESYPNGRFATLADPEGNPIQLWEPVVPQ
ncbi:MAG: VOC family protein [Pseudomonadota bacterium]